MKFAIIDIGSSFTKAAVFDTAALTLTRRRVAPAPPRRDTGNAFAFEVPVRLFFEEVKQIIDESGREAGGLDGVILATQMHGYVHADPGSPKEACYVSWQDARCLEPLPGGNETALDRLRRMFPPETMRNNGLRVKPSLALCNLYARHGAGGQRPAGEFFTLGSYIISRLTGNNVCHITNGAPTGLVDVHNRRWNADVIREAGFSELRFPELACGMDPCGMYRASWGETPVYPDAGDQQAAVLGCMPLPGEAVVNIATAAQIGRVADGFTPRADMRYEARPYFEGRFLNTVSNMPAGRALDVFINLFGEIGEKLFDAAPDAEAIWKRLDSILASSPATADQESGLAVDVNFYETPDSLPSGAIRNITGRNLTLPSLFTAAYREMAAVYRCYLAKLCADEVCSGLVFSGGVSWKNRLLTDAIARGTGLPGRLSPMKDEVFLGMARLALVCSGACRTLEDTRETGMELKKDSQS